MSEPQSAQSEHEHAFTEPLHDGRTFVNVNDPTDAVSYWACVCGQQTAKRMRLQSPEV